MSVVDTWNWDKVKPTFKDTFEADTETKLHMLLHDFENDFGVSPNRINLGNKLVEELRNKYFADIAPLGSLEEMAEIRRSGVVGEYEGVPIKVDYDNPYGIEVGCVIKWLEPKY
jgi:hypothetical protein